MLAARARRYGKELVKGQYTGLAATPALNGLSVNSADFWILDAGQWLIPTLLTFVEHWIAVVIYAFFVEVVKILTTTLVHAFVRHPAWLLNTNAGRQAVVNGRKCG